MKWSSTTTKTLTRPYTGAHTLAVEATEIYEEARETVAKFIGARTNELVWTSNATEALELNQLPPIPMPHWAAEEKPRHASALVLADEILTTEIEHHANLIPWQELAFRTCYLALRSCQRRRIIAL